MTSRKLLCATAALGIGLIAGSVTATAAPIAVWTVEPAVPADLPDSATWGPFAANVGAGTFTAAHASALTDWSTPAGNGSTDSYSSNTWAVGDYYQVQVNTSGQSGVYLSFDQAGSNTGPRDFKVQYSTDGSTYNDVASYSLPSLSWSSVTYNPASTFGPYSNIAFDNQPTLYFRLTNNGTTSINGGTVAAGGTGRVDNITVGLLADIPEPASMGVLATAGLMLARRRRND